MSYALPPKAARAPLHLQRLMDREGFTQRLRGKEALVEAVTEILYRHNPVNLRTTDPREFLAEAETIVALLPEGASLPETRTIVHGEFVNWFDAEMAGGESGYTQIATEVWHAAQRMRTQATLSLDTAPSLLRTVLPPAFG